MHSNILRITREEKEKKIELRARIAFELTHRKRTEHDDLSANNNRFAFLRFISAILIFWCAFCIATLFLSPHVQHDFIQSEIHFYLAVSPSGLLVISMNIYRYNLVAKIVAASLYGMSVR